MKIVLKATRGPNRGREFELHGHDTFVVGRSGGAGVRLPIVDEALSRVHFLIELNPPACRLVDMASTNGTYVNGRRVDAIDLKDGDAIRAGKTTLRVRVVVEDDAVPETREWPGPPPPEAATADDCDDGPPDLPGLAIEGELGRGGMGVVYRARAADGGAVAVKMLHPGAVRVEGAVPRFLREAAILRRLDHPGIVRFREIGHRRGLLYFVMDLVPGRDASALVQDEGPLAVGRAVEVASQVLEALAHAHDLGFVHRDVKPKNLLVTTEAGRDSVKLADFGLARLYLDSPLSGLSVIGQAAGTFGYMPPEQITRFRDARPLADQYAAGATLYFLLTGRTPLDFPEGVQQQLAILLRDAEPVPLRSRRPDVPEAVAQAVHRSLRPDPSERFPDARAMLAALAPYRLPGSS